MQTAHTAITSHKPIMNFIQYKIHIFVMDELSGTRISFDVGCRGHDGRRGLAPLVKRPAASVVACSCNLSEPLTQPFSARTNTCMYNRECLHAW